MTPEGASSSRESEGSDGDRLRAVVVDDQPVVRAGVRTLLEQDGISVVAEAGRLADAMRIMRRCAPDLLILDPDLPDGDGIAALPRLGTEAPHCRIVMLTPNGEPHRVHLAFTNGAAGYLLKSTPATGLAATVRDVAAGSRYIDPTLRSHVLHAAVTDPSDPLSPREREVLRLLAKGHTNQELARTLFISTRTVETHRRNIMQKLRLASRADIVTYALGAGILEPLRR